MTTTPANPQVDAIRLSVQQAYYNLNALIDGPLATLDPAKLYETANEDEWSIMQNLAHIIEFMPYWGHEIEKLVAHPGQNFGRTMQHEGRLRGIEEHSRDDLEQIRSLLPGSYAELARVLASLKDSDLQLTGIHPRYGEKSLEWFIDDFVTRHLNDHVDQLEECLQEKE